MTAKWFPTSPTIWDRCAQLDLPRNVMFFYNHVLLTPHRNTEGVWRWPVSYIQEDLKPWDYDREEIEACLKVLEDKHLIEYDWTHQVILDRFALDTVAVKGELHIKGAINKLKQLPRSPLILRLLAIAEHKDSGSQGLAAAIRKEMSWVTKMPWDGPLAKPSLRLPNDLPTDENKDLPKTGSSSRHLRDSSSDGALEVETGADPDELRLLRARKKRAEDENDAETLQQVRGRLEELGDWSA